MAEIDPVILRLIAENRQYIANVEKAAKATKSAMTRSQRDVSNLEQQFKRSSSSIKNEVRGLAKQLAAAFTVREIGRFIDSYTRLQNQLRVVGLEGEQLADVQQRLREIGGRYGVELEALAGVFNKASQAQQDLGASSEQIVQLNEAIAASLKIAGTSTAQASGALLQLGQALGSGIVRAEEFNSILEGAFPLAQAAARGIDGFEGSVTKLRAAIADGEVTSKQFFEGILKGSIQTIEQAESATLTLAGAFTVLRNELTIYVGEASKSNGVTESLSIGIKALAENLDTLTNVLAVIATIWFGRFAAGALAAGTGLRTISAFASIATTSLAGTALAARATGAALLTAFGGPVGLAISALIIGIVAVNREVSALERASQEYKDQATSTTIATNSLREAQERLANAHGQTRKEALAAAKAERENAIKKLESARASLALAAAEKFRAREKLREESRSTGSGGVFGFGNQVTAGAASGRADANFDVARQNVIDLRKAITDISSVISPAPVANVTSPSTGGSSKSRAGRGAGEIEARFNSELISLTQQTLSAQQDLAANAEERAELELRIVELARISAIEGIKAEKDYSDAQKKRLIGQVEALAQFERERVERDRSAQVEQDTADLREEIYRVEEQALRDILDNAVTQKDRREILLDLVDLEFQHREATLEALLASKTISDAEKERARIALESLRDARTGSENRARRDSEGPAENFLRVLREDAERYDEQIEGIAVDGLQSLNNQLADAIANSESLGNVFSNVAKQIVADLLRIAIQQSLIKPLAESLFSGSSGGGGFLSSIGAGLGSIFGRTSGGFVAPGQLVRVNEGASPGNVEGFVPTGGGEVIPLGQMNVQPSQLPAQQSIVRLYVQEGQMFVPRVEEISGNVSVQVVTEAAAPIVDAAVSETFRRGGRPRI